MLALARLLLEALELLELPLARLVDEPLLDVGGKLDREDAELAVVVHLDGRVARRARRLLVRGEQRVLERRDERALLDSLVALDLANGLDDLLAHDTSHPSIRLARTISSYGMSSLVAVGDGDGDAVLSGGDDLALQLLAAERRAA